MNMPPKKQVVVMADAAPVVWPESTMDSYDFTKISMKETYSITPAESAIATARILLGGTLLSTEGQKARAPPTAVARPAPTEMPIADPMLGLFQS